MSSGGIRAQRVEATPHPGPRPCKGRGDGGRDAEECSVIRRRWFNVGINVDRLYLGFHRLCGMGSLIFNGLEIGRSTLPTFSTLLTWITWKERWFRWRGDKRPPREKRICEDFFESRGTERY